MSDTGRREARIITGICLVIAGSCVASAVSPAIEATLNLWVGVPIAVIGVGALVVLLVRSVWSWLVDARERGKR